MASQSFAAYLQRKQRVATTEDTPAVVSGIPEPIRIKHIPDEDQDQTRTPKDENQSNDLSDGEIVAHTSSDTNAEDTIKDSEETALHQMSMDSFSDLQVALSAAAAGLNVLASEKKAPFKPIVPFRPQPIDFAEDGDDETSETDSESSADESDVDVRQTQVTKKAEISDDEEEVPAGPLTTKNEFVPPVMKPSVEKIPPHEQLISVGKISSILHNTVVIQSRMLQSPCEALDAETIVAFADGTVLGVVDETFGPVYQPMYIVRFETPNEINREKASVGAELFIAPTRSKHILPQTLQQSKGTDASNVFDEELPPEQQEFSDDEQEAAFKRQLKQSKRKRDTKAVPPTPPQSSKQRPPVVPSRQPDQIFNQPGPPPTFQPFQGTMPMNYNAPPAPMPLAHNQFVNMGMPMMYPGQFPTMGQNPYMNYMPQVPMTPQSQQQMQQMLMQTLYMLQQQQHQQQNQQQ